MSVCDSLRGEAQKESCKESCPTILRRHTLYILKAFLTYYFLEQFALRIGKFLCGTQNIEHPVAGFAEPRYCTGSGNARRSIPI